MSELNDRQAACVMAIEEIRLIVKQIAGENQISVPAMAMEMYLVSLAMKEEYWTPSLKMADHFCLMMELDAGEMHRQAMELYYEMRKQIEEDRNAEPLDG